MSVNVTELCERREMKKEEGRGDFDRLSRHLLETTKRDQYPVTRSTNPGPCSFARGRGSAYLHKDGWQQRSRC